MGFNFHLTLLTLISLLALGLGLYGLNYWADACNCGADGS